MTPNKKQLKQYPYLWRHLNQYLHLYPWKHVRNWNKFVEAAGIASHDLALARLPMFAWGWPTPIITVKDLSYRGSVYGHFDPYRPREILLSIDMVKRFEESPNNKKGQELVIAKTLHEMVHWANYNFSKLSLKVTPENRFQEKGNAFEMAVYNRVIQMKDNEW